jgi:hypothetical protein
MKSITALSLLVLAALNGMAQKYVPTTNTLNKKVMFGYQGWHATPNDGSNNNVWRHWFGGRQPDAKNANFDLWPDMREYPADVLEATNMKYPDGSSAKLYSAYKYGAVDLHFKWMMEHELDGVFQQRFVTDINGRGGARHFNQVVRNVKQASEKYKRVYCIMYDISGTGPTWKQDIMKDWMYLVDSLKVTKGSSYLNHKGKPLLAIWGMGFDHNQFATVAQSDSLLNWFHTNAPKKYQATIMGGINDTWQTHSDAWKAVYNKMDVISPWAVGRYHDWRTIESFKKRALIPDKAYTDQRKIDYMPVIFPGFSWYNLRRGKAPFNQIPRNYGEFYWHQSYNVNDVGVNMVYIAMFDEVDEGTAMYKAAPTAAERPINEKFLSLDQDGVVMPSDWYLQLAHATSDIVRGKTKNEYGHAVPKDFHFNYYLYAIGLDYNKPPNFTSTDTVSHRNYVPHNGYGASMSSPNYKLTSSDKAVTMIAIFHPTDSSKMKTIGRWSYNEDNHQRHINGLLDSVVDNTKVYGPKYGILDTNKVAMFKGEELKRYGADDAGLADIPVKYPYEKKYRKMKLFFMYKKGRGEVYVEYFYNDDISFQKAFEETKYMLTYK